MSALAPCPFCNCAMEVATYGSVMKFVGDHDGACPIGWSGEQFSASLSESNLVWASGCWNRRAPLPAEQPSNPVPLMSRKVELELLAVAEACVAQGCIVAMEDWIEARIVGQQTNSEGK